MTNLNYLKYFYDAARSESVSKAAKINYISSSAVSQAIKWLENWYQMKLVEHGKNRFVLTDKGLELSKYAEGLLQEVSNFEEKAFALAKPGRGVFRFSMQQSIANTVVSKVIKPFSDKYPDLDLKVGIGTTNRCKELMDASQVNYSISMNNLPFDANAIELYAGKFVFISAKSDNRSPKEAGFLTTEETKEVIELKANYYKKYKKELPVNNTISSWGVIANMALAGVGIAYIPSYILKGIDKSKYKIRKIDLQTASYKVNFYYSKGLTLTSPQKDFIKEVKRAFK